MIRVHEQLGIYKVIQESRSGDGRGEERIFSDSRLGIIRIRYAWAYLILIRYAQALQYMSPAELAYPEIFNIHIHIENWPGIETDISSTLFPHKDIICI